MLWVPRLIRAQKSSIVKPHPNGRRLRGSPKTASHIRKKWDKTGYRGSKARGLKIKGTGFIGRYTNIHKAEGD